MIYLLYKSLTGYCDSLASNQITPTGAAAISSALRSPCCRLETLKYV